MGLLLLNKSPGITSFDALRDIKRILGTPKVGHTGTLDKFAQGLLIVLAGRCLKLSRWFTHLDKQYTGKIRFGIETDTLDPEGNQTAQAEPPSREEVQKVLPLFTGAILQEPPAYSAIHVDGKRASDLARFGKTPVMKKREVTIFKLELKDWQPPFAEIFVHCSSGTYIRSLARDIALACGSRAHLCELSRTQVGGFKLENAFSISHGGAEAQRHGEEKKFAEPIDKNIISLLGMPYFDVTEQEAQNIFHGKPLEVLMENKTLDFSVPSCLCESSSCGQSAAVFCKDKLAAVVENTGGKWKYGCVFL
ncbi:MAG: tRNA pseudouridine(55) synthase TruB [Treponema sp.]|nr:tRNA pseudouridine(55) synthase TruB [Treponema sp.]